MISQQHCVFLKRSVFENLSKSLGIHVFPWHANPGNSCHFWADFQKNSCVNKTRTIFKRCNGIRRRHTTIATITSAGPVMSLEQRLSGPEKSLHQFKTLRKYCQQRSVALFPVCVRRRRNHARIEWHSRDRAFTGIVFTQFGNGFTTKMEARNTCNDPFCNMSFLMVRHQENDTSQKMTFPDGWKCHCFKSDIFRWCKISK